MTWALPFASAACFALVTPPVASKLPDVASNEISVPAATGFPERSASAVMVAASVPPALGIQPLGQSYNSGYTTYYQWSLAEVPYGAGKALVLGAANQDMFDGTLRETRVALEAGDRFVLYTDGVTEARRGGEVLGEARLVEIARGLYGASSQAGTIRIITNKPSTAGFSAAYDLQVNAVAPHGDVDAAVEREPVVEVVVGPDREVVSVVGVPGHRRGLQLSVLPG